MNAKILLFGKMRL